MITPTIIREKSEKLWSSFLVSALTDTPFFPKTIPTESGKKMDFLARLEAYQLLRSKAKPMVKWSYSLEFNVVRKQGQGKQEILQQVFFESAKDYLKFLDLEQVFKRFELQTSQLLQQFPELKSWILRKPLKIIELMDKWELLMEVCKYMRDEYDVKQPNYLRALPIPNVDTKFVEHHKFILYELLNEILPVEKIDAEVTGVKQFEKRFFIKEIELFVLVRQLETDYQGKQWSISELTASPLSCKWVFIVENKLNCIMFPRVQDSIVIFGKGYAVEALQSVKWLKEKMIYYWGDMDTNGFHILSILRGFLPKTTSFLMADVTLFESTLYQNAKAKEMKPRLELPQRLTANELQMYHHLLNNWFSII